MKFLYWSKDALAGLNKTVALLLGNFFISLKIEIKEFSKVFETSNLILFFNLFLKKLTCFPIINTLIIFFFKLYKFILSFNFGKPPTIQ